MIKWEGIFENWRSFLFITYQETKTSLIFLKCDMVRELFDIEVVLRNMLLKLCYKTVELTNFDQLTSRRISGGNKVNFKN
jgi:hypothetical protein